MIFPGRKKRSKLSSPNGIFTSVFTMRRQRAGGSDGRPKKNQLLA